MTQILAIDDSLTIRTLLSESLEKSGFEVVTAVDGKDGLEKYRSKDIDVVITDINMPNLDGFGVISEIRKGNHRPNIPILVLTTETSDKLKMRAKENGATGWVVKPFSEDSLVSALKRLVA